MRPRGAQIPSAERRGSFLLPERPELLRGAAIRRTVPLRRGWPAISRTRRVARRSPPLGEWSLSLSRRLRRRFQRLADPCARWPPDPTGSARVPDSAARASCLRTHSDPEGSAKSHGDSAVDERSEVLAWAGVGPRSRRDRRTTPADSAVDERSEEMVEAAGVEPASGSAPARDPTGLVRPGVSPRS